MDLKRAMQERHTVRKYMDKPLSDDIIEKLQERVKQNNEKYNLSIKLVINDQSALIGFAKMFISKGVNNFFVLAGEEGSDEYCGYCSADIMLYAQTLGLNTWWVGGMYNKKGAKEKTDGSHTVGIVAVGYGSTQGTAHKSKDFSQVCSYDGDMPQWFIDGVNAALLAPTAINKQAFKITGSGNKVSISYKFGPFDEVDKGLVKYHFELGAGIENFEWE